MAGAKRRRNSSSYGPKSAPPCRPARTGRSGPAGTTTASMARPRAARLTNSSSRPFPSKSGTKAPRRPIAGSGSICREQDDARSASAIKPLDNIPSPFTFARKLGQKSPSSQVRKIRRSFPSAATRRTISNGWRHAAFRSSDCLAICGAGRFNLRPDYLESLERYQADLPLAPGQGNFMLADQEARFLRDLFAAEADFIPAPFASRLKGVLQQHIALRGFYRKSNGLQRHSKRPYRKALAVGQCREFWPHHSRVYAGQIRARGFGGLAGSWTLAAGHRAGARGHSPLAQRDFAAARSARPSEARESARSFSIAERRQWHLEGSSAKARTRAKPWTDGAPGARISGRRGTQLWRSCADNFSQ